MRNLVLTASVLFTVAVASGATRELDRSARELPLRNWLPVLSDAAVTSNLTGGEITTMALPSAAGHFIAVTPCRVVDTRLPDSAHGGPSLAGAVPRAFDIPTGSCPGIPVAAAYSLNISVTGSTPGASQFLTAYPAGTVRPTIATMTFNGGATTTNAALVPADGSGAIEIYVSTSSHVIIDINGYIKEGVVTSVTAGTALAGGGIGDVNVSVAPGGISATELGPNAVTTGAIANGAVTDTKLATIAASGKVLNSATTATSANVADAIVARDGNGAFAAGALTVGGKITQTSDDGLVSSGTFNAGAIPASGTGTRLLWYPGKGAIRAGSINTNDIHDHNNDLTMPSPGNQWDDGNIGVNSVAFGENVRASGDSGVALGKASSASGTSAFAAGEASVATGAASVALGYHAHTNARQGSFVFADRSTVNTFRAGVNHSSNWRVSGGFRVFTSSNISTGVTIQSGSSVSNWGQSNAVISTSTGAYLHTNGTWTNSSSREKKTAFTPIDSRSVLQRVVDLPIHSWRYKSEDSGVRHIGPTSQDFREAFVLGDDDETIGTVDADGVALAAIQGLHTELRERDDEIASLRERLERQAATMDGLKELVCTDHPTAGVCR